MGEINLTRGKALEVYQCRSSLHSSAKMMFKNGPMFC